MEVMVFTGKYN